MPASEGTTMLQSKEGFDIFVAYDPDATERFDQNGGVLKSRAAHSFRKKAIKHFGVMITTLTSTNIIVTIYGRVGSLWSVLWTKTYTTVTTKPEDVLVTEPCALLCVGLQSTGDVAADSVTISVVSDEEE